MIRPPAIAWRRQAPPLRGVRRGDRPVALAPLLDLPGRLESEA
jgi:hypothetical protein